MQDNLKTKTEITVF